MIASSICPSSRFLPNFQRAKPLGSPAILQDQQVRRAQNGDLEAFNELVLIYQDRIFSQALWMLNDEAAAEDAAQETFLQAYRKLHTFRGDSFRAWILKITTNYCLDQIRAGKRHPAQPIDPVNDDGEEIEPSWIKDAGDSPERLVERCEVGAAIAQAVQTLSPEYRAVVILIDLQQVDYVEASAILRVPLGTIKSRLARGREKLRESLSKSSVLS